MFHRHYIYSSKANSIVPLAASFINMFCMSKIDVADETNSGVKTYVYFAPPISFMAFMSHLPVLPWLGLVGDSDVEFRIPISSSLFLYQCCLLSFLKQSKDDSS